MESCATWRRRLLSQSPSSAFFALQDPFGDVFGEAVRHIVDIGGFQDDHTAEAGILEEPVRPAVAADGDVTGCIDPQARCRAGDDLQRELVIVFGDLLEDVLQFVCKHVQTGALGFLQFDNHIRALNLTQLNLADRIAQGAHARMWNNVILHFRHEVPDSVLCLWSIES
ncbi:hypothetical protein QW131_16915 [Roseibium salinum]|nr:hypothetical protein [Roseibium salinum]